MIKIDNLGKVGLINSPKRKTKIGKQNSFSNFLSNSDDEIQTQQVFSPTIISNFNLIDFELENTNQDQEAKEQANNLLNALHDLHQEICNGKIAQNNLEKISKLSESITDVFISPELRDLLDEIELRAMVELEKYKKEKS